MTALSLQVLKYQHQVTHIAHSYWSVVGFYHIEEQCPWLIHSRLLLFDLVNEWYASQWYGFVRGCSKSTDCVNVASNLNGWFSSFHSMAGRGYCHQLNWCILVNAGLHGPNLKFPRKTCPSVAFLDFYFVAYPPIFYKQGFLVLPQNSMCRSCRSAAILDCYSIM